ncbi:MAG: TolC family protein [Desulfobacterales bacterium]|nr:TolC family protein [Desulfobacterales bacterium]
MTLNEAVQIAIRNNRQIQSAYMDRTLQKFSFKVITNKFSPVIRLQGNTGLQSDTLTPRDERQKDQTSDNFQTDISANVSKMIPTGGTLSYQFARSESDSRTNDSRHINKDNSSRNSMSLGFRQPLLKGAGTAVTMAPIQAAKRNEIRNRLYLKSTLINTVTEVILAYRNLLQISKQVDINKTSLNRAKELLAVNELLIETGRMPSMEIVQTESDIANREFSYQQTLNSYDNARLNLIKLLDVNKDSDIIAVDKIVIETIEPDLQKCLDMAYARRSDYISAKLSLEDAKSNLILAKNNMLWDLALDSQYRFMDAYDKLSWNPDQQSFQVGLELTIPIYGDLSREESSLNAKIAFKKADLNLQELSNNVEIEVFDAIRNVKMRNIQVKLAEKARELSEKKVTIEQLKLNLGRSTNFQLVSFQNDLVSAQNNELEAQISYLNALTGLDQLIGTTLDTWGIEFKDEHKLESEY